MHRLFTLNCTLPLLCPIRMSRRVLIFNIINHKSKFAHEQKQPREKINRHSHYLNILPNKRLKQNHTQTKKSKRILQASAGFRI